MSYYLPPRPPFENPGLAYIKKYGIPEKSEDIVKYSDFLRSESYAGNNVPIRLRAIRHRFGVKVEVKPLMRDTEGVILDWVGLILINSSLSEVRQKFTQAHEFIEFLFLACKDSQNWKSSYFAQDGVDKEAVCHYGAANLLMPGDSLKRFIEGKPPSLLFASNLAGNIKVSFTACAHRLVDITNHKCAMIVWARSQFYSRNNNSNWYVKWIVPSTPCLNWLSKKAVTPLSPIIQTASQQREIYKEGTCLQIGGVYVECHIEAKMVTFAGEKRIIAFINFV